MRVPRITVYVRPGCHLCEEAVAMIESLRCKCPPFVLACVDIEADESLHVRMLERIPVVTVDGQEVAELVPDRADLASAILSAASMATDEHDSRTG